MVWRLACLIGGLPVGALAVLAFAEAPSWRSVELAAAASGLLLLAVSSWLARRRGGDPDRGRHLARSASVGLAALPACGAALLGLQPDPRWLLAAVVVGLGVALRRGARARGPIRLSRLLLAMILVPVAATVALVALSASLAALGARAPQLGRGLADRIYDFDAQVETLPLPDCAPRAAGSRVLATRGAHPRLSRDGTFLWFDALPAERELEAGAYAPARQIHRMDLESGEVRCWTCGQPGNNLRPAPSPDGAVVVFDSDRDASWRHPTNTELYRVRAQGDQPPRGARRMTFSPGPDDHAVLGPRADMVVWSRGARGRYFVAGASLVRGHGGEMLGRPTVLHAGRAQWTAPLGWSRNARALVVVRGNPLRPLEAKRVDLATGEVAALTDSASPSAAVGFSDDGDSIALARCRRARVLGLLPANLGFVLGGLATRAEQTATLFRDTALVAGTLGGPLPELALGAIRDWGEPTGVALSPDATRIYLGQRRPVADGGQRRSAAERAQAVEERLLEIALECGSGA